MRKKNVFGILNLVFHRKALSWWHTRNCVPWSHSEMPLQWWIWGNFFPRWYNSKSRKVSLLLEMGIGTGHKFNVTSIYNCGLILHDWKTSIWKRRFGWELVLCYNEELRIVYFHFESQVTWYHWQSDCEIFLFVLCNFAVTVSIWPGQQYNLQAKWKPVVCINNIGVEKRTLRLYSLVFYSLSVFAKMF